MTLLPRAARVIAFCAHLTSSVAIRTFKQNNIMHSVDGQGPTLGEMQPMLDVNEPSSPLSESHLSPKRDDAIATATHRPPMSVVVIQESKNESPLGTLNEDSQHGSSSWAPPPMMVSVGTPEESRASWQRSQASANESMSTAPCTFSSSFKLKPRNPFPFASPSRAGGRGGSLGAPRGRKRPAHSMSIPAGSVSSSESPLRPPRPFYGKDDRSDVSSTKAESVSGGSDSTAKDSSMSPPIFEMECLNLKSLSLQSPTKTSPPSFRGNRHGSSRSRTSSFTMYGYGASPAGSVTRAATNTSASESTSSSFVVGTPSSSTRSSPRHVPLTVLSQGGQSLVSPSKNSLVRPPRHGGGPSLLFSLDQDEDDSEDDGIAFPRKLPTSSCNSSISSEDTDRKIPMYSSSSLGSTMYTSPVKTATSSPKTPLPRIMLTPRTPQSTGSRRKTGLPMFPSPSDDGIDTTSIGDTPQTNTSSIDEAMDTLLNGFARRGHPARFHSTTGYIPPLDEIQAKESRYHNSSNSLAYSLAHSVENNNGDAAGANDGQEEREESFLPRRTPSPTAIESNNVNTNPPTLPRAWLLPMPSDSNGMNRSQHGSNDLPRPPPTIERSTKASSATPQLSNHDTILRAMMDETARARAAHADSDSLSDSCEEDAFVLTCPSDVTTSEREDCYRPPKQPRRESHENLATISSNSFLNGGRRESCTSLASGLASATSLFGMEFYQEEGQSMTSPPVHRSTTPFSSHSIRSNTNSGSNGELSNRDGDEGFAPLGMHHRFRRSENSFGSLGLSLDGPSVPVDDQERDLVTPPVTRQVAFSPPPLPVQKGQRESFCPTPKSKSEEGTASPPSMQPDEQP